MPPKVCAQLYSPETFKGNQATCEDDHKGKEFLLSLFLTRVMGPYCTPEIDAKLLGHCCPRGKLNSLKFP